MAEPCHNTRPEELETAHLALNGAAAEPGHSPTEDRLIDAIIALLAYVEKLPRPKPPPEDDGESLLTDPRAIARRHHVDVTSLLKSTELLASTGVLLSPNETLFLADILQLLGFE
jgi:hypothetical protein